MDSHKLAPIYGLHYVMLTPFCKPILANSSGWLTLYPEPDIANSSTWSTLFP